MNRPIHIRLFGQIRLEAMNGASYRGIMAGDMRVALLAYLAVGLPGARRRDKVRATFWPEASDEEARHRLRQLLYVLRSELGEDALLSENREVIGLNPARFWCDVVAFKEATGSGQFGTAVDLYTGPFCEGLFVRESGGFERWLEETREQLHETAVECAWRLAQDHESRGDLAQACACGRHALRLDPDEERLRWLLELYRRRGDRVRAMRMYESFRVMLAREFELQPSIETIAVMHRIRSVVNV